MRDFQSRTAKMRRQNTHHKIARSCEGSAPVFGENVPWKIGHPIETQTPRARMISRHYAVDTKGKKYDIEIRRSDKGNGPRQTRGQI